MCGDEAQTKSVGLQRFDDIQGTHPVSSTSPWKRYDNVIILVSVEESKGMMNAQGNFPANH
jgi:hypothetical protein